MPSESIHACITSPPYWGLRDYGVDGQMGLEKTPEEYVAKMVGVFHEVRRVLRGDGTLWLNLGDSYAGSGKGGNPTNSLYQKQRTNQGSYSVVGQTARDAAHTMGPGMDRCGGLKPKDLVGIPWRVAFALQADGWYLRQDIIWSKPNPMPESVTDRCTKAHEYIFLLAKSQRYYFDAEAIKEKGSVGAFARTKYNGESSVDTKIRGFNTSCGSDGSRNKRSVWTVASQPYADVHFATFPPDLIRPCILAGCPTRGTVLDPFAGSGTTGEVAEMEGRNSILIELNPAYIKMAEKRTAQQGLFARAL